MEVDETKDMEFHEISLIYFLQNPTRCSSVLHTQINQILILVWLQHDNNIVTTMKITQTYPEHYVPYASYLVLELHEIDSQFYVQMLYRNSTSLPQPHVIPITGKMGVRIGGPSIVYRIYEKCWYRMSLLLRNDYVQF